MSESPPNPPERAPLDRLDLADLDLICREVPETAPATPESVVLVRVGLRCNHHCPMCTAESGPGASIVPLDEMQRRLDVVAAEGFRRVALTGGEPTMHPEFWAIVAATRARGLRWDLHTNGRRFAEPGLAERAVAEGLERALVSFHSHVEEAAGAIAGGRLRTVASTAEGIERLSGAGVDVMLNCVLTALNKDHLAEYVDASAARFGNDVALKFAFPNLDSRGANWAPTLIRYRDVQDAVRALPASAARHGITIHFESFPSCVLGDPDAVSTGRPAWGETHYLDDRTGRTLRYIPHVDARTNVFAAECRRCAAFGRCPGLNVEYVKRFGLSELDPFPRTDVPWWMG